MKIIIKATNLSLNKTLKSYIQEKINSLEKFAKIFQEKNYYNGFFKKGKPRIEAWVEIGRVTSHHQKGKVFRAEAQMRFPKKSLRAEAERTDLKLAIIEVKDELQRELKQCREKEISKYKRGTRRLKKDLHLSSFARFYRKGRIREEGI